MGSTLVVVAGAAALAEGACLHAVAARGHLAPAAGTVLRGVVERPAAVRVAARLHPLPGAVAHRAEDGREDLTEGVVDTARGRLDSPRLVVVEGGPAPCARGRLVEPRQRLPVQRLAVVRAHHVAQRLAYLQRPAPILLGHVELLESELAEEVPKLLGGTELLLDLALLVMDGVHEPPHVLETLGRWIRVVRHLTLQIVA